MSLKHSKTRSAAQSSFFQTSGITFEQPNIRAPAPKRRKYAARESDIASIEPAIVAATAPASTAASGSANANANGIGSGNGNGNGHGHASSIYTSTRSRSQLQAPDTPAAPVASPARSLRTRTATGTATPTATASTSARRGRGMHNSRRYTSAGAAALAVSQGDGYKPREERGWEEFHPDLDIDSKIAVFSAEEVDGTGRSALDEDEQREDLSADNYSSRATGSPALRRSGRKRWYYQEPKEVPAPIPIVPDTTSATNPKLTLPKPQFTRKDPFEAFESDRAGQQNYVDRTMASVGYQESDLFIRNARGYIRMAEGAAEEDFDLDTSASDGNPNAAIGGAGVGRVEYDMDEQDEKWLEEYNQQRRAEQYEPIKPAIFEITMTKIEKEWYALEKRIPKPNPKPPQTQRPRSSSAAAVNGEHEGAEEPDTKCAVCDDGDCENANAIVFCDGCDLAVHQECYGVPFIPEGQWLCRKCQLMGPGSPCCSFCPNTEGAFKQTNTSKWAHLLCAIWIPEVSLGNPSLMEPIIDVEKIPRGRWKLTCYICRQKMGACIQCANKNCFVAFHVTCARRAQLYTKMKINPGAPAVTDSQGLKAFCDKHVPDEWREEHDTDNAITEAMEYYRVTMSGRKWPDSQAVALSIGPSSDEEYDPPDNAQQVAQASRLTLTVGGNKRKRTMPRTVWKLPSGAPVIPQVILNSLIVALGRFTVRQRRQYAEDACKYWTLKREARRGAALLKRLQLQLETFSSMEMTRRNFAGMGVAGAVRLQRRIAFADHLYMDVDRVRMLCDEVKKRERDKLKDAELLCQIVDIVYFPTVRLMWPILEKAFKLDNKTHYFNKGLMHVRDKLSMRAYGSITEFSQDLANIFTEELGINSVADTGQLLAQMDGRPTGVDLEVRNKRKLAKRITKAIQPSLEDILKKESELSGRPFEKELENLDAMFSGGVLAQRERSEASNDGRMQSIEQPEAIKTENDVQGNANVQGGQEPAVQPKEQEVGKVSLDDHNDACGDDHKPMCVTSENDLTEKESTTNPHPPATDELEQPAGVQAPVEVHTEQQHGIGPGTEIHEPNPLSAGGIMWYMEPFDPIGTTIHEERWTGREVLREMSEELSDFDEEEIREFIEDELGEKKEGGKIRPPARDRNGRFKPKDEAESEEAVLETIEVPIEEAPVVNERRSQRPKRRRRWY
ncbi:PHD finger domain-containing protein [Ascosphaera apis ARSEF 7405]|uniref:PHD finger domain-containing protein n=1 Tax=Ascosphaera apis ARSEF 7405 TaxID=392613 RepID=A0A167W906_9EURO|nr:PHD finger domain-containing protein [Ascosphaera apis ARSEF 7405]